MSIKETKVIKEYIRTGDNTYLTYPEWKLVFSSKELKDFMKYNNAIHFKYLQHILSFWISYAEMRKKIKTKYKFNFEYNIMLITIGISTTIEYLTKSLYGNTIGYLFELIDNKGRSESEESAYIYMKEYIDFIEHMPWYSFDYNKHLQNLWKKKTFNSIRDFERKIALSLELIIKLIYAKIIKKSAEKSFKKPEEFTSVKIQNKELINFRRYQNFTTDIIKYAKENPTDVIESIAGNTDVILISIISNKLTYLSKIEKEFNYKNEILEIERITKEKRRELNEIKIKDLIEFINICENNKDIIEIEHIFDF